MKSVRVYLSLLLTMLIVVPFSVRAQTTYTVKGKVTEAGVPVRYVLVTFTDSRNTQTQYSAVTDTSGTYQLGTITGVKLSGNQPTDFKLEQNYPNPFSSSTAISYALNKQLDVKVTIYDVLGRVVQNYSMGPQEAGSHGVIWNGRNELGQRVAPGVYFYRLQAGRDISVKKMVFGVGAMNSAVLRHNISPSLSAEVGTPAGVSASTETFNVQIVNTDSTYPGTVSTQFRGVTISSDTSVDFAVLAPTPDEVLLDSTQQIIRGFGAANIVGWRPDMTPAEVLTAFGNGQNQLGLTIMRLRIPPDSTQFSIDIPSAKIAEGLGAIVFATPWTPPAWMKTNNNISGGNLDTNNYGAFAAFLKSFADTMANNGAPVYAVSVQNEPDFNASYESCLWNGTQFLNFMRNYAPAVGVPVLMPESENYNHSLSDPTLNDSVAASHVAFIGGHLYGVTPSTYPLAISKGKELWMTEHYTTSTDSANVWSTAIPVAKEISDCMNVSMSAYVWWYIVRFYGPIDENGNPTKRGFIMSQFSKFVRPGFHKVFAKYNPQQNIYLTAYKDGSKVVVVALNMGSSTAFQPITMVSGSPTSFLPYTTSATQSCAQGNSINVVDGSFTATLPASSVTTFVSN
jgi:glucuronoarabinoxylan endo-1,4-beta-xylanase